MPKSNIHMDSLTISAIDAGTIYFDLQTGEETMHFCMPVGRYRRYLASATRRVDEWIAEQSAPAVLAEWRAARG